MDSINKNQPEENHRDLAGSDAVERIKKTVSKSDTCFFCTESVEGGSGDSGVSGGSNGARPMSVQKVDEDGTLWFLSASDSHKNQEIHADPNVKLFFQGSAHAAFLQLGGLAEITRDEQRIHDLWEPILKTWFTEGEKDPRITAISVRPTDGYYWDNKHGAAVAGVKMLIGAATGTTLDDSIEGKVRV